MTVFCGDMCVTLIRDETYGYWRVMPRPSDEELVAYYTNYHNSCRPYNVDARAALVCNHVTRPGRRVFDIGCGQGELLGAFARQGWEAVGIELCVDDIQIARNAGLRIVEGMLTKQITAQAIEEFGAFDVVLLVNVLEHVADPEGMMDNVRRLLVSGGTLFCVVPNEFNPFQEVAAAVCGLSQWWIAPPEHLNYFSIESVAGFIAGHGFDITLKTTDFPIEMFLLWGDVYVGDREVGKRVHNKRRRFENALLQNGKGQLLQDMYEVLATLNIGRSAIICAEKAK